MQGACRSAGWAKQSAATHPVLGGSLGRVEVRVGGRVGPVEELRGGVVLLLLLLLLLRLLLPRGPRSGSAAAVERRGVEGVVGAHELVKHVHLVRRRHGEGALLAGQQGLRMPPIGHGLAHLRTGEEPLQNLLGLLHARAGRPVRHALLLVGAAAHGAGGAAPPPRRPRWHVLAPRRGRAQWPRMTYAMRTDPRGQPAQGVRARRHEGSQTTCAEARPRGRRGPGSLCSARTHRTHPRQSSSSWTGRRVTRAPSAARPDKPCEAQGHPRRHSAPRMRRMRVRPPPGVCVCAGGGERTPRAASRGGVIDGDMWSWRM
eukprot:scaffold1651_cov297-Prasinococcus_capsulatus_cf.AAC.3